MIKVRSGTEGGGMCMCQWMTREYWPDPKMQTKKTQAQNIKYKTWLYRT